MTLKHFCHLTKESSKLKNFKKKKIDMVEASKPAQLSVISLVRDENKAPRAPEKVGS